MCLVDLSPVQSCTPMPKRASARWRATPPMRPSCAGRRPKVTLAMVTVPHDPAALQIVKAVRRLNRACVILVRCRYQSSMATIRRAGANAAVSEEVEASAGLLRLLEGLPGPG